MTIEEFEKAVIKELLPWKPYMFEGSLFNTKIQGLQGSKKVSVTSMFPNPKLPRFCVISATAETYEEAFEECLNKLKELF